MYSFIFNSLVFILTNVLSTINVKYYNSYLIFYNSYGLFYMTYDLFYNSNQILYNID